MVYFVSFLFIGRVLLFKLITVSSMQIFKFTIEDAYLKRLSHRKRSARISFQMLKQDNVVSLETWRNIYITWHEHDVGFVRTWFLIISLFHVSVMSLKLQQYHSYRSLIPCKKMTRKSTLECTFCYDEYITRASRSTQVRHFSHSLAHTVQLHPRIT